MAPATRLAFALVVAGMAVLMVAGFKQTVEMGPRQGTLPNVWVLLGGLVVLLLALLDLGVRRRHDRNRSGTDCAAVLIVLAGLGVAGLFGRLRPFEELAAGGIAAVLVFYLLVLLAVLPGTPGPNRYGEPPQPDV